MKLTRQSVLAASSLVIGGLIGASALVALANSVDGTFKSATCSPAECNTPAPINVGSGLALLNITGIQEKTDSMIIDGGLNVRGNLIIATGTSATPDVSGYVLTAIDHFGTVAWKPQNTIKQYGSVSTLTFNSSGNSLTGCLESSASGMAYCVNDSDPITAGANSTESGFPFKTKEYHPSFGCIAPYQLVTYFTGITGKFTAQSQSQIGYCVSALNIM